MSALVGVYLTSDVDCLESVQDEPARRSSHERNPRGGSDYELRGESWRVLALFSQGLGLSLSTGRFGAGGMLEVTFKRNAQRPPLYGLRSYEAAPSHVTTKLKEHPASAFLFSVGAGRTCRHRTAVRCVTMYFFSAEAAAVKNHHHERGLLGAVQVASPPPSSKWTAWTDWFAQAVQGALMLDYYYMPTRHVRGSFWFGRVLPDNITSSFARQWRADVAVDMQW